jgi:lambda family phage minor tail protein L
MSSRAYDYKLTVNSVADFEQNSIIIGSNSDAVAEIVAIDTANDQLKVRMANLYVDFEIGEPIYSNSALLVTYNAFIDHSSNITGTNNVFVLPDTYSLVQLKDSISVYVDDKVMSRDSYVINSNNTIQFLPIERQLTVEANSTTVFSELRETVIFPTTNNDSLLIQVVTGNTVAPSFISANFEGYTTTASSVLLEIADSPYISEKNATEQSALVKLYSIYYPGEWYPTKPSGNPSGSGDGFPWPYGFPIRYAEVLGDDIFDNNYSVYFGNTKFDTTAIESDSISIDGSGKINEITLTVSNFDGSIADLVENRNILGYNVSRSTIAEVNGEQVQNIDPRTLTANIFFDAQVFAERGPNAPWDYESTILEGDTWLPLRDDSRDLTGAVVEIKLTYAKFLDYWPEYSLVTQVTNNVANVYTSSIYRVGDSLTGEFTSNTANIISIVGNTLFLSNNSLNVLSANNRLLITNPDADSSAFVKHVFVLNSLEELDELTAKFSLASWLQYFKQSIPKRKFYSSSCPFKYKGELCKYPVNGSGPIIDSVPQVQANGFFTINNASTENLNQDICAKTLTACKLRNNLVNFGGFPSVQ